MPANRCSPCGLNWPYTVRYAKCPRCGESTSYMYLQHAMPEGEAESLRHHIEFEHWLEQETPEARAERERRFRQEQAERLAALEALVAEPQPST